jgi:hypothetical protein
MTRVPMGLSSQLPAKNGFGVPKSPNVEQRYPGVQFSQFTGAEMIARNYGFSREDLDRYALLSHQRAAAATRAGRFNAEIVPVEVRLADGTLAGSTLTMNVALKNLVSIGLTLADASNRLSRYPADYLGITERGRLAEGAYADLVLLDTQLNLNEVFVEGECLGLADA